MFVRAMCCCSLCVVAVFVVVKCVGYCIPDGVYCCMVCIIAMCVLLLHICTHCYIVGMGLVHNTFCMIFHSKYNTLQQALCLLLELARKNNKSNDVFQKQTTKKPFLTLAAAARKFAFDLVEQMERVFGGE